VISLGPDVPGLEAIDIGQRGLVNALRDRQLSNDAAGFASCYGPLSRSPKNGHSTLGFDPARFQTKPPVCYRAPWRLPGPDSHRQATTS
jgi:hypothetical protein